jgi:hypothetical protein
LGIFFFFWQIEGEVTTYDNVCVLSVWALEPIFLHFSSIHCNTFWIHTIMCVSCLLALVPIFIHFFLYTL